MHDDENDNDVLSASDALELLELKKTIEDFTEFLKAFNERMKSW